MDPQQTGQLIGQLLAVLLLALAPLIAFRRAAKAEPRSRRLAGYALACGLLVLPLFGAAPLARGSGGRPVFFVIGGSMILAGLVAVALVVAAQKARETDDGPRGGAAPWAVGLALGCVVFGALTVAFPLIRNPSGGGQSATAWAHKVDPPGFELTLPSDRWKKYDKAGEIALFGSRLPQMVASVKEVRPATAAAGFEMTIADLKRLVARSGVTTVEEKREPNAHGHEHWRFLGEEKTDKGRVMVAMSATWWNKTHAVVVLFEGQYRMVSQAGQDQESEEFKAAARSILRSVK